MGKFTTASQRGFTLIEMSIVLVIIGLIVGGILKGQELIESARQKNAVSQVDRIKSGVTTFVDRYKSMPGDFGRAATVLGNSVSNGDDNGQIGARLASTAAMLTTADATGTSETVQFWTHLLTANAVSGGTATVSTANPAGFSGISASPSPLPSSSFPQTGLSVAYGVHTGETANSGTILEGHWLLLHRWTGNGAMAAGTAAAVSPARAYQMDNKYDDGLPDSGAIRTLGVGTNCGSLATNSYGITDTSVACHLAFVLD